LKRALQILTPKGMTCGELARGKQAYQPADMQAVHVPEKK
jgi:hypothetical protein